MASQGSVPPQALDAERAVLGAILKDGTAVDKVLPVLPDERDFYAPKHQLIYAAMRRLYNKSEPIDIVTVVADLLSVDKLRRVGGRVYLIETMEDVASTANVVHYAGIVADQSKRRRVISSCAELINSAYSQELGVPTLIDQWQQAAFDIGRGGQREGFRPLSDDNPAWLARVDDFQTGRGAGHRLLTGFTDVDRQLQGLAPTELVIVAGETGAGKTQFLVQWLQHVAFEQNKNVALLSLEMGTGEINARVQCHQAGVDYTKVEREGGLSSAEFDALVRAAEATKEPRIFVDDCALTTGAELMANTRLLVSRHDVKLLAVDYVQLMDAIGSEETRERVVSNLVRWLKIIGKELGIVVVGLSQITAVRGVKPGVTSLRESRAIAHHANQVLICHHSEEGGSILYIAKNRRGPSDVDIRMNFESGRWGRWNPLEPREEQEMFV